MISWRWGVVWKYWLKGEDNISAKKYARWNKVKGDHYWSITLQIIDKPLVAEIGNVTYPFENERPSVVKTHPGKYNTCHVLRQSGITYTLNIGHIHTYFFSIYSNATLRLVARIPSINNIFEIVRNSYHVDLICIRSSETWYHH